MSTQPPARRRGLGRGLDALLASSDPERDIASGAPGLIDVDPHRVHPNPEQPRRHFDHGALTALADSIRLHGLLHPIVLEPDADGYRLVAGERRLRAARLAGVATIPAIVRPAAESGRHQLELALTENLLREELNPIEEAAAYARLADAFGLSHEAIAMRLGRSRPAVSNTIRLLNLAAAVQEATAAGRISAGHARALLSLPTEQEQEAMAARIEAEGLSVRATESAVERRLRDAAPQPSPVTVTEVTLPSADDEALRRGFEQAVGLPVEIQRKRRGGRVVISFAGDSDLDALYDRLAGPPL